MAFEVTQAIDRNTKLWRMLKALPKIELHRHLEGSIRIETLVEVAETNSIPLPSYDIEFLRPYVQMMREDPPTHKTFLSKFSALRQLFVSEDVIRRIAREAVEDAAEDNIRYMELRFTPYAQAKLMGFALADVVDWISDEVRTAAEAKDIKVNLIVAMNRHESVEIGWAMFQTAIDFADRGIVGVDLCGNEVGHPADPFAEIFLEAPTVGLGVTIHAGEWWGPENVQYAIEHIGTPRIGHGVRTVEDSQTLQLALNHGTSFEVCPTSNMQTGVVGLIEHHPLIDLCHMNAKVTLNTDDPAIHNITLTDEYALLVQGMKLPLAYLKACILNAIRCSFLPENERIALEAEFQPALSNLDILIQETEH